MKSPDSLSILVFKLSEEVSNPEAEFLRRKVDEFLSRGGDCVLLDFSDVEHIDSSGLGTIVAVRRSTRMRGGALGAFGLRRKVAYLFRITRLEEIVPVFSDELEAIRHFASTGAGSIYRYNVSLGALAN